MKKNLLKIDFISFWPNFIKNDNFFYHLLNLNYEVVIDQINPDVVFFSYDYSGEKKFLEYSDRDCIKIFYTGENYYPEKEFYDYVFSFEETKGNNIRLPLWVLHINWFGLRNKSSRDISFHINKKNLLNNKNIKLTNKMFCSFVASQPKGKRVDFVPKLSQHKEIDCGGRLFNNINLVKGRGDQKWKYKFLSNYKFNIAFENEIANGYITEKIIQPMSVNSIPIYWGSEIVKQDFNPNSFIYSPDFSNDEELIEEIIKLDSNKKKYLEKLNEPWFKDNKIPENFLPEFYLEKFSKQILN